MFKMWIVSSQVGKNYSKKDFFLIFIFSDTIIIVITIITIIRATDAILYAYAIAYNQDGCLVVDPKV